MATHNRFSSRPQTSLLPWLGIAAIVILSDQVTKIAITR
ncbi:MAG: signal peptidase II, partial [Burkholderiaceae bacterium]|nr:signal peptidase II [Burkholderiaceae bacterium]